MGHRRHEHRRRRLLTIAFDLPSTLPSRSFVLLPLFLLFHNHNLANIPQHAGVCMTTICIIILNFVLLPNPRTILETIPLCYIVRSFFVIVAFTYFQTARCPVSHLSSFIDVFICMYVHNNETKYHEVDDHMVLELQYHMKLDVGEAGQRGTDAGGEWVAIRFDGKGRPRRTPCSGNMIPTFISTVATPEKPSWLGATEPRSRQVLQLSISATCSPQSYSAERVVICMSIYDVFFTRSTDILHFRVLRGSVNEFLDCRTPVSLVTIRFRRFPVHRLGHDTRTTEE